MASGADDLEGAADPRGHLSSTVALVWAAIVIVALGRVAAPASGQSAINHEAEG